MPNEPTRSNKKRDASESSGNNNSSDSRRRGGDGNSTAVNERSGAEEIDSALVFEDPFGDEFEDEEFEDDGDNIDEDGDEDEDAEGLDMPVDQMDVDDEGGEPVKQVWRPGIDQLEQVYIEFIYFSL